jgi:MraZ protein
MEVRCVFFFGQYEHTIDAKQRLAIPADHRAVLEKDELGSVLIAAPGSNGAIFLWPEKYFRQFADSLGGSLMGDEDLFEYEQMLFSESQGCPLDSVGRIRLPERLIERYGLSRSVMVLGVKDHLEVIDLEQWKQKQASRPADDDVLRRARQAYAAKLRRGGES